LEFVPLLGIEQFADLYDGPDAAPYLEERTRHPSHHSAKKCRSDHVHPHLISDSSNADGPEGPARVVHVGFEFLRERSEIVITDELCRSLLHHLQVQRESRFEDIACSMGVAWSKVNSVSIESILCTKPGVERLGHPARAMNDEVGRQHLGENSSPTFWRHAGVGVEVTNLTFCMSPAIRTARSRDLVFLARDAANSFFQGSPNISQMFGPCGPPAEIGPVVSNDELNSHD
jgi:hypothetical protein